MKELELAGKVKTNQRVKSQRNLASQFGISVGTVNNILKRKREYENLGEENYNPNVKTLPPDESLKQGRNSLCSLYFRHMCA